MAEKCKVERSESTMQKTLVKTLVESQFGQIDSERSRDHLINTEEDL